MVHCMYGIYVVVNIKGEAYPLYTLNTTLHISYHTTYIIHSMHILHA